MIGGNDRAMTSYIKYLLTFIFHPIAAMTFLLRGRKKVIIGRGMHFRSLKDIDFGNNVSIGNNGRIVCIRKHGGQQYTPGIKLGNNVCIINHFTALSTAPIVIEDNCLIASFVLVTSENHGFDPEMAKSYSPTPLTAEPVTIKNGCFIGEKASVMPGVTIGERSIVAANSVVTRDVPPYSMVAGAPAKVIRTWDAAIKKWVKPID